jgi:hypothetical protein
MIHALLTSPLSDCDAQSEFPPLAENAQIATARIDPDAVTHDRSVSGLGFGVEASRDVGDRVTTCAVQF